MTTIYWTPSNPSTYYDKAHPDHGVFKEVYVVFNEPKPYLQYIFEKRGREDAFTSCPAFLDYFKNTYVITSPFDFTVDYTKNKLTFISSNENVQRFLKICSNDRAYEQPKDSLPVKIGRAHV